MASLQKLRALHTVRTVVPGGFQAAGPSTSSRDSRCRNILVPSHVRQFHLSSSSRSPFSSSGPSASSGSSARVSAASLGGGLALGLGSAVFVLAEESQEAAADERQLPAVGAAPIGLGSVPIPGLSQGQATSRPAAPRRKHLPNPGRFEEASHDAKEVLEAQTWSGARFSVNRAVFPEPAQAMPTAGAQKKKQLSVGMNVHLGPPTQNKPEGSSCDFVAQCNLPPNHMLMAHMENNGTLQGKYAYTFSKALQAKAGFQILPDHPQYNSLSFDVDYKGTDYTTHLNMTNPSQPTISLAYMQSVTPTIALGIQGINHSPRTFLTYVARYKKVKGSRAMGQQTGEIATLTYMDRGMLSASYLRKVTPQLSLATELQLVTQSHESAVSMGARYAGRTYAFTAGVDSNFRVSGVLDQMLSEYMRFSLCGEVYHGTKECTFGFGLQFG